MNSRQQLRARLVLGCICIAACGLALALFSAQILKGETYAEKGRKQYVRPAATLFDRGSIFFTAKDGSQSTAATLTMGSIVYMNPSLIKDADGTFDALSQYIELDYEQFMKKASLQTDPYEELARKVDPLVGQSIASLKLVGVGVAKETRRAYASGPLAAHALGIVGENNTSGKIEGRYGLERSYEEILKRTGDTSTSNIFAHIFSSIYDSFSTPEEGDLVTTIEPTVQDQLEKTLMRTLSQWNSDEIGGIIMDPKTGKIVAMGALPNFDLNNLAAVKDPAVFSNPLVESSYELGSIMKPLTIAVALDTKAVPLSYTYDDTGTMTLSGKKISNFDGVARGVVPLQEILSQSLNVGTAKLALKIGKDDFSKYFTSFGFGSKTNIDQPNETAGLTANLESGRDIEIATMAYGQGIALSPIAMTKALAVLANNGKTVQPHFGEKIKYIDGSEKILEYPKGKSVLKPESVEQVTRMLVEVVDTALRKGELKMEHYTIAAKTGTAQIPNPSTKTYYPDRYLHSFFGYFPAYEPKFIVFLYQVNPKGAKFASDTLTNPFGDITKFLIDYYNIPPDR
ncbi:MAG: penicillin-binding protein 2 [bacterium]|nr:penicillin-binding protein 2 [bacterium]